MKILHVVRQYYPVVGGMETYVDELTKSQRQKHDVTILTLDRDFGTGERFPKSEVINGIAVQRVGYLGRRGIFLPLISPAYLSKFDVVHVHGVDMFADVIALMSLFLRVRFMVTTHGLYFHTRRFAWLKQVYLRTVTRFTLGRAVDVLAISRNDQDILSSAGIGAVLTRSAIRPLGDATCEGGDLIYLGRLSPNKRLDKLLAFFARIRRHDTNITLHIVGTDAEGLEISLKDVSDKLGLDAAVKFHGFFARDELLNLCRSCGYIVSASRYEGFGLSIVEGMSIGLLPVLHDNAAFREIIEASGVGLLCNFDDPDDAAEKFISYRRSADVAQRSTACAFSRSHSWQALSDSIESTYRQVLGPRDCAIEKGS